MVIKRKLVKKSLGLAVFFIILIVAAILLFLYTQSPYKQQTFQIQDFEYNSETGTGHNMLGEDGTIYTIAPEYRSDFDASDFFYDTLYNDEVKVYVHKSVDKDCKTMLVYGVECNGKVYLDLEEKGINLWWLFVVIGFFLIVVAFVKILQISKVTGRQALWAQRRYLIILYDKSGDLLLVPCSTTSYLYPNVEMMGSFYAVSRVQAKEGLWEYLDKAFEGCYGSLANPSKLELLLKNTYGVRSLKDFLQYQKILYVVRDEKDGYFLRKMKSVLLAPEQNVFEIVTEGKHLQNEVSREELVASILAETNGKQ